MCVCMFSSGLLSLRLFTGKSLSPVVLRTEDCFPRHYIAVPPAGAVVGAPFANANALSPQARRATSVFPRPCSAGKAIGKSASLSASNSAPVLALAHSHHAKDSDQYNRDDQDRDRVLARAQEEGMTVEQTTLQLHPSLLPSHVEERPGPSAVAALDNSSESELFGFEEPCVAGAASATPGEITVGNERRGGARDHERGRLLPAPSARSGLGSSEDEDLSINMPPYARMAAMAQVCAICVCVCVCVFVCVPSGLFLSSPVVPGLERAAAQRCPAHACARLRPRPAPPPLRSVVNRLPVWLTVSLRALFANLLIGCFLCPPHTPPTLPPRTRV
jgi:hypothetical protein